MKVISNKSRFTLNLHLFDKYKRALLIFPLENDLRRGYMTKIKT